MTIHLKKKIFYGNYDQQFSNLYKPENKKNIPVVIVIHGGYWKDSHNLDSYATASIVDYLQDFNVAIWDLEYRRMDKAGENVKAPWPILFQDVANGIDHLRTIEHKEELDLSRILLIGHSAGAHLATWAASRKMIAPDSELYNANPLPIHKVISIAGILNLFQTTDVDQPEQIIRLMGGSSKIYSERYRACDPSSLNNPNIDLTLVHGEQDTCVKASQARYFCSNAKGRVKQVIMPAADHFSMLPHDGHWVEAQWQEIKDLLTAQLKSLT